jgi:hypothetical protein
VDQPKHYRGWTGEQVYLRNDLSCGRGSGVRAGD